MSLFLSYLIIVSYLITYLVPCSLINLDFILSHTTHFYKIISFPLFVPATFAFLLFASFYASNNVITKENTRMLMKCLDFVFPVCSFISSCSLKTLFTEANLSSLIYNSTKTLEIKTSMLFN